VQGVAVVEYAIAMLTFRNGAIVCCLGRNVMSSQDVVDFVKQRLESGVTQLSAICEEVRRRYYIVKYYLI